ncbi:MAG TPA: hypothetical protein VJ944_02850 [Thermoplasmataceae archaeon]|nr:hypothetical protein [Thermoplasmataceae archaeon]
MQNCYHRVVGGEAEFSPDDLASYLQEMAAVLLKIHAVDTTENEASFLLDNEKRNEGRA